MTRIGRVGKAVALQPLRLLEIAESYRLQRLTGDHPVGLEYRRVYHVHVRKTGGTSLNHMFLALATEESHRAYKQMAMSLTKQLLRDGKVYVGWSPRLIERGAYFYAFSHIPYHELHLPDSTFTVTMLRDPVWRLLSDYRETLRARETNSSHPFLSQSRQRLGGSLDDYLDVLPETVLLHQLNMFSKALSVDEAFKNVVGCSHFFPAEEFDEGVRELNDKLELELEPIHVRKTERGYDPSPSELDRLRTLLRPEIDLYDRVREAWVSRRGKAG